MLRYNFGSVYIRPILPLHINILYIKNPSVFVFVVYLFVVFKKYNVKLCKEALLVLHILTATDLVETG